MKKTLIFLLVLFLSCTDDQGNPCVYQPTLTTEAVTNITETSATLNGTIDITSENCETPNNTEQGFVYSTEIQPTIEDTQVNVNGTSISTTLEGLTPNTTYYVRSFLTNALGEFYGNEMEFITEEEVCDIVYLDSNGITIKACPDANIGDVGTVNGVQYTVVDREMLDYMLLFEPDVIRVCTTRITDMSFLLWSLESANSSFNQDISSWDVSNVVSMFYMFYGATSFNQDISNWDVSNVTNMNGMFQRNVVFNQPIGNWDVSNVGNMSAMFSNSQAFNQPIGNWDTSNVTIMSYMFDKAQSFNQPIGNWDVSSVISMSEMFQDNVSFNQGIGNWNVSNVTSMFRMFSGAQSFNQNLSSWDVTAVDNCNAFDYNTPQWTLPQPNFTNCNPN